MSRCKKDRPETPNVDQLISFLGQAFGCRLEPMQVGNFVSFWREKEPEVTATWGEQSARATINELATLLKAAGREEVRGMPLGWFTPPAKNANRRRRS